jgi:hypothetical protein
MTTKSIYEMDAAQQLGVPRERLAELRLQLGLKQGEHWRHGKNSRIYLTTTGLGLLVAALESTPEKTPPSNLPENGPEEVDGGKDIPRTPKTIPPKPSEAIAPISAKKEPPGLAGVADVAVLPGVVVKVPRIVKVLVVRLESNELVSVRCRDNRNFVAGMACRVRRPVAGFVWFLEGRAPRRRGKW